MATRKAGFKSAKRKSKKKKLSALAKKKRGTKPKKKLTKKEQERRKLLGTMKNRPAPEAAATGPVTLPDGDPVHTENPNSVDMQTHSPDKTENTEKGEN